MQYNKKTLSALGFDAMCEIDNTYHILNKDLQYLMNEIEREKIKIYGVKVPLKINIS